jgi:hypothetical protein
LQDSDFCDHDEGTLVRLAVDTTEVVDGDGEAVLDAELLKFTDRVSATLKNKIYSFLNELPPS